MIKFIVTGPESSGKTTMCKALSKHFQINHIEEYARKYLENLNRNYNKDDLLKIAKHQKKLEKKNNKINIYDTDLITIKIWSLYKYKVCHEWILNEIDNQKSENRFYILCKPDLPWEYDPLRENPNNRYDIYNLYIEELENLDAKYIICKGNNRTDQAILKISKLISKI